MKQLVRITILLCLIGCNSKDSITQFGEENEMEQEVYVYPSTLRMINLEDDENYNELIGKFEKGQYFSVTRTDENTQKIKELTLEMQKEGYEEAMTINDKNRDVKVYILDDKTSKMAAIMTLDSTYNIIQIEGMINLLKLPKLLQDFNDSTYLDILNIVQTNQKEDRVGHHSQD